MSLPFRIPHPSADRRDPPEESPRRPGEAPPDWLMVTLVLCVVLVLAGLSLLSGRRKASANVLPAPSATAPADTPTAGPAPTPGPTPVSKAPYDWEQPVPQGEMADGETWFQKTVFIGDSRVDGLHTFSGIQGGSFLTYTGLTIYEVEEGKEVIRVGDKKLPVLEALAQGSYDRIYIALGVNELGYFDAQGFGETYGRVIDKLRECQSGAAIYVQAIIPVNTDKCKANKQPYYITNEAIADYNQALADVAARKEVFLLAPPQALVGEDGETLADYSSDGVHFKKEGYKAWLEDLLTHTAQAYLPTPSKNR